MPNMKKIGKYEILEKIGQGGMGIVYKAYDPQIDRDVAIKVIVEKALAIPEIKARFYREARTAGKLSHENITVVYDFGELDEKPYIVMEYLDGRELRSIIDQEEPMTLPQKLDYAIQICRGLEYAHAKKIVHRDIKPENIRILKNGQVKIIDFGIAKPDTSKLAAADKELGTALTEADMRIGTPWYMSPEQVQRKPIDNRSDIFAFGVLLYELLTYRKPFSGDETTVLYKICHVEPDEINLDESGLADELQSVLSKCLAKKADDRYDDCLKLIEDLNNIIEKARQEKRIQELLEEGYALADEQRFNEAILRFSEIQQIDPNHKEANSNIRKLVEREKESATIKILTGRIAGQTISHYKILKRLGGGGMGVVYQAQDTILKRKVALKFLSPELTRDEKAKKRFFKEAQTASALDQRNICTIHEINETEEGLIFICMTYYDGQSLREKIAEGPLPLLDSVNIAIEIARGLTKAHEHGIIHRDIKPANIMVTTEGKVKIVDFGLAKLSGAATRITKTGMTIGTVPYMSPEQIKGDELDHCSDIWSFGVLLYELVTNSLPFHGEYDAAILYSIVNENATSPSKLRPEIPTALEKVISQCLKKTLDERSASMTSILSDLESIRSGLKQGSKLTPAKKAELARFVEIGKIYLNKEKYTDALSSLEKALKLEPENQEVRNLVELCEQKQEDLIKIDALLNQGKAHLEDVQYEQALNAFKEVIACDPNQHEANDLIETIQKILEQTQLVQTHLGDANSKLKEHRFESAIESYKKTLEIDPLNQNARTGIEEAERALAEAQEIAMLLAEGKASLEIKNYSHALSKFEKALTLDPRNEEIHDLIELCKNKEEQQKQITQLLSNGKRLISQGQFEQALSAFREATVIDSDQQEAYALLKQVEQKIERANRIDSLLSEAAAKLYVQEFKPAIETFKNILDIEPENKRALEGCRQAENTLSEREKVDSLIAEGKSCFEQKNYSDALAKFEAAFELNTKNQEARDLITLCRQKQDQQQRVNQLLSDGKELIEKGQHEQALTTLREIIAVDPEREEATVLIQKAEKRIDQAKEINVLLKEAQNNLSGGKVEAAIETLERVLTIDPQNQSAINGIQQAQNSLAEQKKLASLVEKGKSSLKNKNYTDAIARFEAALEFDPNNSEIGNLIVLARKSQEEKDRIGKLLPEGREHLENGRLGPALSAFKEIITIDPDNPKAKAVIAQVEKKIEQANHVKKLILEAQSKLNERQLTPALESYKRVLEVDPQNQAALHGVEQTQAALAQADKFSRLLTEGKSEIKNKNYDIALSKFKAAEKIEPENQEVHELLITCEQNLDKLEKIDQLLDDGREKLENRKYKAALATLEKVILLDTNNRDARVLIKQTRDKIEQINQTNKQEVSGTPVKRKILFLSSGVVAAAVFIWIIVRLLQNTTSQTEIGKTLPAILERALKDLKQVRTQALTAQAEIYAKDVFLKGDNYYNSLITAVDAANLANTDSLLGVALNSKDAFSEAAKRAIALSSKLKQAETTAANTRDNVLQSDAGDMPAFASGEDELRKARKQQQDREFETALFSFAAADSFFNLALEQKDFADLRKKQKAFEEGTRRKLAALAKARSLSDEARDATSRARSNAIALGAQNYAAEAYGYASNRERDGQQFFKNENYAEAQVAFQDATAGYERAHFEKNIYDEAQSFYQKSEYQQSLVEIEKVLTNPPYSGFNKKAQDLSMAARSAERQLSQNISAAQSAATDGELRAAIRFLDELPDRDKNNSQVRNLRQEIIALDEKDPLIDHDPQNRYDPEKPILIRARVSDNLKVAEVLLYFRRKDQQTFTQVPMILNDQEVYAGTILREDHNTREIRYYMTARDIKGNLAEKFANRKKREEFKIKSAEKDPGFIKKIP